MKLIDTHAHLEQVEELDRALEEAARGGVDRIIGVSVDLASSAKNLDIKKSAKNTKIYCAMGMHPSEANLNDLDACVDLIRKERDELVAVGEIGLDFWYKWVRKDTEKKDEQRKVFQTLLELANELNLPAVIHTRGAWRECFETVKAVGLKGCEFHWYSGPLDVLKDMLDQGYYISASPSLAYSAQSREAVSYAPMDRVMIETDCPVFYRASIDGSKEDSQQGFRAEPKDVFRTLKSFCEIKNTDESYAAEILNRNAVKFFSLE